MLSLYDFCGIREDEVNKDYMAEIQNGPTISFSPISYEINNKCEEVSAIVQEMQGDLTRIRNQFKERMVQLYMFSESLKFYIVC